MSHYTFLLDFFPLVDEIVYENPVLGSSLQVLALDLLFGEEHVKEKITILLKLAADLGYTSEEVVEFLLKEL